MAAVLQLLDNSDEYARIKNAVIPYGDGYAAHRVVEAFRHFCGLSSNLPLPFRADLQLLMRDASQDNGI